MHQWDFRDDFISKYTKYSCTVVVLRGVWKSEHFCPGVSCMDLVMYFATGNVKTFCGWSAWKNCYDRHYSRMSCLKNALNPTETETLKETYLSLVVMGNFQGYFIIFHTKVKADIIAPYAQRNLLKVICWVNSVKYTVFKINSSPFVSAFLFGRFYGTSA